jgi:uncharacterized protein (TIGR02599 family)
MRNRKSSPSRGQSRAAFTVVELMCSMGVIVMIMLILVGAVDQTRRVWSRATSKIGQYQAARSAFEALTRNLSQATLNTYYGLEYDDLGNPTAYHRESELHFVSGKAAQAKLLEPLLDGRDPLTFPTHSVFFQAPLGLTAEERIGSSNSGQRLYGNLTNLLSAVGYYIEFGEDNNVPDFLAPLRTGGLAVIPKRNRFRLMEVIQPAESLGIFATSDYLKTLNTKTTDWIQLALGKGTYPNGRAAQSSSWVRAENIVALVILPKLPERDRTPPGSPRLELAPEYEYDSRPTDAAGRRLRKEEVNSNPVQRKQFNQLPPMVQVVMVAIDEPSAIRQEAITGENPPTWTEELFERCNTDEDLLEDIGDPAEPSSKSLIGRLAPNTGQRMEYRVYSADVIIRGAKWSAVD